MALEELALGCRFDAFGDHLEAKAAAHGDDRLRDDGVTLVVRQPADEGTVDLQLIERQSCQIGQ